MVLIRHSCSVKNFLQLTDSQLEMLKRTPFGFLREVPDIKISTDLICSLIDGWDGKRKEFRLRGSAVPFTPHDVTCILGLRACGTHFDVDGEFEKSRVHKLLGVDKLTVTREELVKKITDMNCHNSDEDIVRLEILIGFTYFLFPLPGKRIHDNFLCLLDKLDKLSTWGWGKAVYDFLVSGIDYAQAKLRGQSTFEIQIKGCVHILQVWALEHTRLYYIRSGNMWPRILNWKREKLTKKDIDGMLKGGNTRAGECNVILLLRPTDEEYRQSVVVESYRVVAESHRVVAESHVTAPIDTLADNEKFSHELKELNIRYVEKCRECEQLTSENEKLMSENEKLKMTNLPASKLIEQERVNCELQETLTYAETKIQELSTQWNHAQMLFPEMSKQLEDVRTKLENMKKND